jgi:hypothetical protein
MISPAIRLSTEELAKDGVQTVAALEDAGEQYAQAAVAGAEREVGSGVGLSRNRNTEVPTRARYSSG